MANPLVELPVPFVDVSNVDAVIVTHTHPDHWDAAAKDLLPRDMLIFSQNEEDAEEIRSSDFADVRILDHAVDFGGVRLIKTAGQHGSDQALAVMGDVFGRVCGVVFWHPDEKTVYLAGDTVWNHHVQDAISGYAPEIIIVNSGDAQLVGLGSILMGKKDVLAVHKAAPWATIVATHMEAVNHATLSRKELRTFLEEHGASANVIILEDGKTVDLPRGRNTNRSLRV